jgi:hypothetical protein
MQEKQLVMINVTRNRTSVSCNHPLHVCNQLIVNTNFVIFVGTRTLIFFCFRPQISTKNRKVKIW